MNRSLEMSDTIRKLCLLFILLDNLFVPIKLGFDFRVHYILYFLFIVCYPFTYRTIVIRPIHLQSVILVFFLLFLFPLLHNSGYVEAARQLFLLGFNLVFGFLLLNAYRYDLVRLFKDYIDLIYFAAIVGLIQLSSQIIGFRDGADYSYLGFDMQHFQMANWVIQSFFQEPSFLAIAFAPVAFVGVARLFNMTDLISVRRAIIVLVVLILSKSSVGLIGLMLSILIIGFNKYSVIRSPVFLIGSVIVLIVAGWTFYSFEQVKVRVDDTFALFTSGVVTARDIEAANLSTYSMYSNFKVTQATFTDNFLVGSGLGTYESDYFKYIKSVMPPNRITDQYALNERDANSMLLRIVAELGLFGILLLGWFLLTNRIKMDVPKATSKEQVDYWIINNAVFVLFVIRLIRQGHYTMLGFMLFTLIYFCSKRHFEQLEAKAL